MTNDAWERFSIENGGRAGATGVGVNYLDVCSVATGDDSFLADQACQGIRDVLKGVRNVFELEYPCHSPQTNRWFLLHVSALQGDVQYAVTTHLCITKRKSIENQLVEAERLAAIGQAMQGLSHEGRNSLQRAQGCIDLLRCHVEGDTEALDLVERIETSQRRLISLYEEVRRYAAPITLQRTPYRLSDLVAEVWQSLAIPPGRARLLHLRGCTDPQCDIDVVAIAQVLRSVLENSIATDAMSLEITVSYSSDEKLDRIPSVTVVISDNGPGIPPTAWEKVFEPFYTTKTRGTGLGLALCKRIVEAHGGRISVARSPSGGASVRLTLPACDAGDGKRAAVPTQMS